MTIVGKFATYRKRGSTPPGERDTTPPPAPTLSAPGGELSQHANGIADPGGTIKLYHSDDGATNWTLYDTKSWGLNVLWAHEGGLSDGYYRGTEVGNHSAYEGESLPSNTYSYGG